METTTNSEVDTFEINYLPNLIWTNLKQKPEPE